MRYLSIILFLFTLNGLFAQSDVQNLQKYWKFRSDFVEKFVKIGPGQGESLPAGFISPQNCIDNVSQWANVKYGTMQWGDGMIRHGNYLSLLATEFALRKKYSLPLKGIQNELYYAIAAINRLDERAEHDVQDIYFSKHFYDDRLNGFYLREDIPEDFSKNWADDPMNFGCTNSAYYENNNVGKVNDPDAGLKVKPKTSYQNVPSLDQMSSLLVGLSMVHKLVDDVYVKPTDEDDGFNLKQEVAAITDRMVSYAANRNWQIIDVNGWPVGNGGGDLALAAAPILSAADRITEGKGDYPSTAVRRMQITSTIQYCLTGYGLSSSNRADACDNIHFYDLLEKKAWIGLQDAVPAGPTNNQDESVYQTWLKGGLLRIPVKRLKWLWTGMMAKRFPRTVDDINSDGFFDALPWPLNKINLGEDAITHYNNTIMFNLGIISGWWDSVEVNNWANVTENRQLELTNAVLYDTRPVESKAFYQAYLDSMPMAGGYRLKGINCCPTTADTIVFQKQGWGSDYRWAHPHAAWGDGGGEGIFSGLDYMVYHNLYYLLYSDSLPSYERQYPKGTGNIEQVSLHAAKSQEEKDALRNLNEKLRYVPANPVNAFDKVGNRVVGSFKLEPQFSNYSELGISTVRYVTVPTIVQPSAVLSIETDLVILEGGQLTIQRGAKAIAEGGDILLEEQAVLEVRGELVLNEGSLLKAKSNTVINVKDNANLVIKSGAFLEVTPETTIRLGEAAKLTIEDENYRKKLMPILRKE